MPKKNKAAAPAPPSAPPYAGLTPECLLDAVESTGLRCDGRLTALNSYENRVYQIWLDSGDSVIAKFYRPQRWSAALARAFYLAHTRCRRAG